MGAIICQLFLWTLSPPERLPWRPQVNLGAHCPVFLLFLLYTSWLNYKVFVMVWRFVFLPPFNSYAEILIPKLTVLGSGAFGRKLGQECKSLMNVMSALKNRVLSNSLAPSTKKDTMRNLPGDSPTWPREHYNLRLSATRTRRNRFLLVIHTQFGRRDQEARVRHGTHLLPQTH